LAIEAVDEGRRSPTDGRLAKRDSNRCQAVGALLLGLALAADA
jgi:hypothetical protein